MLRRVLRYPNIISLDVINFRFTDKNQKLIISNDIIFGINYYI
jgi:hypothetical protein